ncbi:MAG: hypothetical protein Q8R92_01540 [Deltaproteobacteria bacterium]|nr:hypothetical protein [Deltaproteobacteria bacterium]
MGPTVNVAGHEIEVESRYRVEVDKWEANLRHPVHGFTVSEWAATPQEAAVAARRALIFYAREMERIVGRPPRPRSRAA